MLEISDWEFKITMISMLRVLREKVDNIKEQNGQYKHGDEHS